MAKKSTFDKFISNLIGFNKAKRNIAKATGIPTTKYGQKAKIKQDCKESYTAF